MGGGRGGGSTANILYFKLATINGENVSDVVTLTLRLKTMDTRNPNSNL